ncbi:MAG: GFA family protein [Pseudomonadales bacterium]|nr:GFA family protein [Pseudomonadales bacterium]NRB40455.1 GFA family protein [Pseudomonadales bacterium]
MSGKFEGGCLCGEVRYSCSEQPMSQFICHCTECQKITGSPVSPGFMVNKSDVKVTGNYSEHKIAAASGREMLRKFCSICGSRVFEESLGMADIYMFNAGSLDDQSVFEPEVHYWVNSLPSWYKITDSLPQYDKQPDVE